MKKETQEEKMIRFIDSSYHTLFYLPDGENIVLTYSDGKKAVRACKYLNESHVQVGNNIFHICEFAGIMERNGTSYVPEKPQKLPKMCYAQLPSSGAIIKIVRGEKGYQECALSTESRENNRRMIDDLNGRRNITYQQEAAMLGGSMFGWRTRAARTDSYDLKGNAVKPEKRRSRKQEETRL